MSVAGVHTLSAVELGNAYRRGELDPISVIDALAMRVDRIDSKINALVTRNPQARADAQASAERFTAGQPIGPLDGIPIAVKDNLVTKGLRTTWGTRGLAEYVPDRDELPIARLRAAGAIIVGKTNVPEFTLEGYTANPLFGVTRNPWNTQLTPGGSSGGSVAGCAAGFFPLALCTDGGGSIRRPAAHAGLVGLKPSIGTIARADGLPQLLLDFEVVGPVARNVDDTVLLFDALRGVDARDRSSLLVASAKVHARSAKILAVASLAGSPIDREIAASFERSIAALSDRGHRVETAALPLSLDAITEFWPLVGQIGLARLFAADAALRECASAKYVDMAEQGARVSATRLLEGLEAVAALRRETDALFERFDFIVTPTTAALPWLAEEAFPSTIDGKSVGPRGHAVFTGWVNACGNPAISVPASPASAGLPIGIQIIGRFGGDDAVLSLAREIELPRVRFPFD
ncbi:MAG TPA: amidase [Casimicrobiaceae bacterium]|nr:amidase [Casimicrobiaceae bacterium]